MNEETPNTESIPLWPDRAPTPGVDDGNHPWLDAYPVATDTPRGAVLICPGGGYSRRAPHEGVTIAQHFNREGLHAFVVHYRVAPHRHPSPIRDAARALRLIRQHAGTWRVDAEHIAILGFSAGGHLAGSLGVLWDKPYLAGPDPIDRISAKPDALILCYAVLSTGEYGHRGSCENLLGPDASPEGLREMSLERGVRHDTPPTFLWHTFADPVVPLENALCFAEALRHHRVPFELHIYPDGKHGLGLAPDSPHVATWFPLCVQWLKGLGWRPDIPEKPEPVV